MQIRKGLNKIMSRGDCIGKKFGRLTIVSEYWDRDRKTTYCKTICDCGNKHIAQKGHLKSGNVKSCGCLVVDVNRKLLNNLKKKIIISLLLGQLYPLVV